MSVKVVPFSTASIDQAFILKWNPVLYKVARAQGVDENQAFDLVQASWIVLFESLRDRKFKGNSSLSTYLVGILKNKILEFYRKSGKWDALPEAEGEIERLFDDTGHWVKKPLTPEEVGEGGDLRRALSGCLAKLPPKLKLVVTLREVEELETEEVCSAMEVSANHFGVLLFRAKAAMKQCLEKRSLDRGRGR